MTTIFVYEYCLALGLGREASDPAHSLYREGRAMQDALAADFAALPDTRVVTLQTATADEEKSRISYLTNSADWTVLIAPEFDGILEQRCHWVRQSQGRLLGPNEEAVRLTADKFALFEHWRTHGIPTPQTWLINEFPDERFPVVVKPRFGAGSTDTALIESQRSFDRPGAIVQEFIPGRAASVAFLVGPEQCVPLVPALQHLAQDGTFQYLGGELPIPPDLAARALRIAARAIACVSGLFGYVGVDLVLGSNPDGSNDHAIEINPRMTTSYVGLRALAKSNLAGAMLSVANGDALAPLEWTDHTIQFRADGSFEHFERTA